jgi:hypothetical protein
MDRICAGCGAPLEIDPRERRKRKWCSGACRARALRLQDGYVAKRNAARAVAPQCHIGFATCRECSELYITRRPAQPSDRCCRKIECRRARKARDQREGRYKVHREHRVRETAAPDAECVACGKMFVRLRPGWAACSSECARIVATLTRMERRAAERAARLLPVLYTGPRPASARARPAEPVGKPRRFIAGSCKWCGDSFVAPHQREARYCSQRCLKASNKAARGRFLIAGTKRRAIYERDTWICQLCGDPVDPTLPPSDVWAATLDHIECQSWALIPDHSPSNLRLAHRWCNSVRGDESTYTAAVLAVPREVSDGWSRVPT